MSDLVKKLREHATDWDGKQMPDLEPAKSDPTAGTLRAAANEIERLTAALATARKDVTDAAQKINLAAVRALELGGEGRLRTTAEIAQHQSGLIMALVQEKQNG